MTPIQIRQAFPLEMASRLRALSRETGDPRADELARDFEVLLRISSGAAQADPGETPLLSLPEDRKDLDSRTLGRETIESFRDRCSTVLMDLYRSTSSPAAFGLLYEINYRPFLNVISARLKKFYFSVDPQDVLQEVFFNIYRYPHKFHADKDRAFRYWASMIIRNTVFKHTREMGKEISREIADEEIESHPDRPGRSPVQLAMTEESRRFCSKIYVLFLELYLAAYEGLSERERKALHIVEVEGHPYKVAAETLGIRLENLKMVVFRARKKIQRALDRAIASAENFRPGFLKNAACYRFRNTGGDRILLPSSLRRKGSERPGGVPNSLDDLRPRNQEIPSP